MLELATGPAQIIVTVPPRVPIRLVSTDRGFGGHGYDVRFNRSDKLPNTEQVLKVLIKVRAPARNTPEGPLPLRVTLTPLDTGRLVADEAEGLANTWVVLRTP
jgi:hypothetical protein